MSISRHHSFSLYQTGAYHMTWEYKITICPQMFLSIKLQISISPTLWKLFRYCQAQFLGLTVISKGLFVRLYINKPMKYIYIYSLRLQGSRIMTMPGFSAAVCTCKTKKLDTAHDIDIRSQEIRSLANISNNVTDPPQKQCRAAALRSMFYRRDYEAEQQYPLP